LDRVRTRLDPSLGNNAKVRALGICTRTRSFKYELRTWPANIPFELVELANSTVSHLLSLSFFVLNQVNQVATTMSCCKPIIFVIGGPGCGKGTQCDLIVKK
jgi:hypothetical protein